MELRMREVDKDAGAKPKGSNGVVAVGLPHRNYSVFKQTHYQLKGSKRKNKKKARGEHQRIDIRRSIRRKLQKQWWKIEGGLAKRRALFPEGRGLGVGGRKRM
jgi:hypothetical protein